MICRFVMHIHFAFGNDKNDSMKQCNKFIDLVLKQKRLKFTKCCEFLPALPRQGAYTIDPRSMTKVMSTPKGVVEEKSDPTFSGSSLIKGDQIGYLPEKVNMICFIKISFNKLRNSPHSQIYGKLGSVFTEKFLKKSGVKPVCYYTEKQLKDDPLIIRWNQSKDHVEKTLLSKEILQYRKPASMWESFHNAASRVVHLKSTSSSGFSAKLWVYDRYQIGYDFTLENEHRIVGGDSEQYMYFSEEDLYMVIVPDKERAFVINKYFEDNWTYIPKVKIFPKGDI